MEKEQKQFEPVKEFFEGYIEGYKDAVEMMSLSTTHLGSKLLSDTETLIKNKISVMELCDEGKGRQ